MRSKWKGNNIELSLIKKKKENIRSRRSLVLEEYLGERIGIYNGKKNVSILVREAMLGNKYGQYAVTRRLIGGKGKEKKMIKKR